MHSKKKLPEWAQSFIIDNMWCPMENTEDQTPFHGVLHSHANALMLMPDHSGEEGCTAAVCEVVCCMEVIPGQ